MKFTNCYYQIHDFHKGASDFAAGGLGVFFWFQGLVTYAQYGGSVWQLNIVSYWYAFISNISTVFN